MKNPRRTLVVNLILAVLLTGLLIGASFVKDLNDVSLVFNGLSFGFSADSGFLTSDESYKRGSKGEASISDVHSLDIGWTAGRIEIVRSEGNTIRFSEKSGKDLEDGQIMRWKNHNGTLSIRFGTKGGAFRQDPEKTLTVELPADWAAENFTVQTVSASLELDSMVTTDFNFDSVSGSITADAIDGKIIHLNSVSGAVRLKKVDCERMSVDNVSGSITVENASVTKDAEVSTVSGNFRFTGSADSLSVDTTSGDTELLFTAVGSNIEVDSTSGDTTVTLPADVSGFTAEIDSLSGELTCDFDVSHRDDSVKYGDGSLEIEVDTTSGDLRIQKAE